ncbi:Hsp33 family molecular chaperone HslO, partial [Nitratireductor sp. GCM10026969]
MSEQSIKLGEFGFAGDDHVVPFDVDALDVRGRAVQVGPMLDQILDRHAYPEPVARLLAEVVVLTVLLGSALKFDGKFIVQTRSDGPVDMLVADFATPGSVRAYAHFDDERLQQATAEGADSPAALLGTGVLALTIDQGAYMQRYQGVVELDGSDLEEVARSYFRQSEQIPTDVRLGVARIVVPGEGGGAERWRA